MIGFKEYINETAANAVAGGGVDLTPHKKSDFTYTRRDKRKREDTDSMYKRSLGLKHIKDMLERNKK